MNFDTSSEIKRNIEENTSNRTGQKSKPAILRPIRASENGERSMQQSVNRTNRKMEFDDFKTKSITFDKDITSMKSLKNIVSFKKTDTIKDFKEFFNDARTLIIYEETIKLTWLLANLNKDIADINF
jgi:hypothetical protein